jgi:hypothetical protein
MSHPVKQSTAGQIIPLGEFLDSTDGNTGEPSLTIANTDIKIWKNGATSLASKNSGGATYISNNVYYATFDATDSNTLGPMVIFVHVAGALAVKVTCIVYPATEYEALFAGTGNGIRADVRSLNGVASAGSQLSRHFGANDGEGFGSVLCVTTIDAVTSQTQFTLTAGSADDGAYPAGSLVIVSDPISPDQRCVGVLDSWTGSTLGIVLKADPGVFTMASSDDVVIMAAPYQVDLVDAPNATAVTAIQNGLATPTNITAGTITTVTNLTNAATNGDLTATMKASVNTEADTALTDYDAPTKAEMDTLIGTPAGADVSADIAAVKTQTAAIEVDTADIQSRIPAALVSGRIDATVGAMQTNVITTASITNGAYTAAKFATAFLTSTLLDASAVSEIADGVFDEALSGHTTAGTFGAASQVIRSSTAQAGASTTVTLDASASAVDDFYNDTLVHVLAGTGAGQSRLITDYVGSTKVATVSSAWVTTPSSDSEFVILPQSDIAGASAPSAADVRAEMDSNSTQLAAIVADTNELQGDWANGGRLDLIVDELTTQGDTNETKLDTNQTDLDAILLDLTDGTVVVGSLSTTAKANVNAEVDTALSDYDPPTRTEATTDKDAILTRLGTPADTDVSTDIANLPTVASMLTTQMTESYAADATVPTLAQAIFALLSEKRASISGVTLTTKKIDGSTTAETYTLDDATDPSSRTRTT